MSTVTEIREAIRKLPAKDAWQLARELVNISTISGTNNSKPM